MALAAQSVQPGAMLRYELPFPPTVNHLFASVGKRRVRTARYQAWAREAGNFILIQGKRRMHGRVAISLSLVRPDKRRRDLSNTIKAVEDLLVDMSVIDDDSLVQRISVQWATSGPPCTVLIHQYEGVEP